MNYLQLVNDFLTESALGDTVGSVSTDTFEGRKAALWIKDAWVEIQRARRWKFRWAEGSFASVIDQNIYTLANLSLTDGVLFKNKEFYLVDGSGTRFHLTPEFYSVIKAKKRVSDTSGQPSYITEKPNGDLEVYPKPDAVYTIEYEYFIAPIELSDALDVPAFPAEYHKAITWKALENYAREEGGEWKGLYQTAIRNYNAIYTQLINTQLPSSSLGGSPFNT